MPETTCCPDCGAELPTGATGGLCPRCLLGAGLSSDAGQESPAESPFAATTPQAGGFVPPTPASLAGYFPDLEILEIIGQGGMGAVYKARQKKLDRLVALKIIRPESADDPAFAERFTREARTLARLSHANIVSIHDFDKISVSQDDSAQPRTLFFFVMEFVDGANLRELMQSSELQPVQSLAIVPQICDALQFAHDEGIVHRDIKPENILIDRRGRVKIADFGLAKLAGQSPENFTLTGTHQVMGTPRYMAPEQMGGSKLVDHRADIYSLGVVLYEMLTGELPMGRFDAPSQKVAVDVRLDDVVHHALAAEPDRRYQRASEIRTDMESIAMDALSRGEMESVAGDVSVPAGLPGPSTIMERQVAGVVNWFKGGRSPDSDQQPAPISSSDRTAIQQQVRGPAISLIVLGSLVALAGLAVTIEAGRGGTFDGTVLLLLAAVAFVCAGLICRGGWHLLTLDSYRPAVLAGLLGQPVGIWALTFLSRDEIRSAFRTDDPGLRGSFAKLFLNSTLWGVLIGVGGIAVTFLPWGDIYNNISDPPVWAPAAGFGWSHGMIACSASLIAALFFLATVALRPVPVWRPLVTVILAAVIITCSASFVTALGNQTLAVQPLLDAAKWGISTIEGRSPQTIDEVDTVARVLSGPYLLMAIGVGLLVIAAIDFRMALQPASAASPRRAATAATVPRFSRKAIVGACWAPLFILAIVALTVTSDFMVHRNRQIPEPASFNMLVLLPVGAVALLGLLAPFATTILGVMAISDIRQSRVRGLGLAYLDAIFFPLLVLDVVLLFGVGVLASALFETSATYIFVMPLGGPFCLLLDAIIAAWGWKRVSRSVLTDSRKLSSPQLSTGRSISDMEHSPSAATTSKPTSVSAIEAESSTTSLDFRRLEMQLKTPAAGLIVVALLGVAFWCVPAFVLVWEGWSVSSGAFNPGMADLIGVFAGGIALLLVVGTMIHGARHMRRLTGIGWCYAAAILALIPWAATSIVGFFVGIWVLNVLGRPEVKEAFVQRSLELEQHGRSHP